MEKLSLLVAVHVALAAALVLASQMTSAEQLPSSSSGASVDDEPPTSDVDWNGFDGPIVDTDDKRKWGNNKARMWGKRSDDEKRAAWGQKSSRLWGKRLDADELARLLQEGRISPFAADTELQDKRKWAKNKARMWGK